MLHRRGEAVAQTISRSAVLASASLVVFSTNQVCFPLSANLSQPQVTNTPWGDRVAFPFAPSGDTTPKPLHVSPLQDMQGTWVLRASDPREGSLHVYVAVKHPTYGTFFFATLDAEEALLPVADPERWSYLMPHKVAVWIYWHAAVLLVSKGLQFFGHPKNSPDLQPGEDYRDPPLRRAKVEGWKACPVFAADGATPRTRPYVFTDATEYPWK